MRDIFPRSPRDFAWFPQFSHCEKDGKEESSPAICLFHLLFCASSRLCISCVFFDVETDRNRIIPFHWCWMPPVVYCQGWPDGEVVSSFHALSRHSGRWGSTWNEETSSECLAHYSMVIARSGNRLIASFNLFPLLSMPISRVFPTLQRLIASFCCLLQIRVLLLMTYCSIFALKVNMLLN